MMLSACIFEEMTLAADFYVKECSFEFWKYVSANLKNEKVWLVTAEMIDEKKKSKNKSYILM